MLFQQSKSAALGDMVAAITHQLKQPLNSLGILIQSLKNHYDLGEMDGKLLEEYEEIGMNQILHMSSTIDHFKNFMTPDKMKSYY